MKMNSIIQVSSRQLMIPAACLMLSVQAFAQQAITVKGVVRDKAGMELIGASVAVKGSTKGVITDIDGRFTLKANQGDVLVISFLGYRTREVPVSPTMDVTLEEATELLDDVVVIGYGTVKKDDATGSVSAIKPDELSKGITTSAQDMLAGKVAGVSVTSNDGAPGSSSTIRIRGGSSLNASNDPLIVIDGLPIDNNGIKGMSNGLSMVNPNDIETFTVLKDASATAIYGSRASNGVIIITTKKGKSGSGPKVSYNGYVSMATATKKYDVLSGDEYRAYIQHLKDNGAQLDTPLGDANTDWQDEIFREAVSTEHNISVTGGLKNMPYRVSMGYNYNDGIIKTSNYQRFTTAVNLAPSFFDDHLRFNINAKYMHGKNRFVDAGVILGSALAMDPTRPVYSDDPDAVKFFGGYYQKSVGFAVSDPDWTAKPYENSPRNPVAELHQKNDGSRSDDFIGNIEMDYRVHFLPDLRIHASLGGEYAEGTQRTVISPYSYSNNYYGWDGMQTEFKYSTTLNAYAQYVKELGNHTLDVMVGGEEQHFHRTGYSQGAGWDSYLQQKYKEEKRSEKAYGTHNSLVSYFGRLNYTLLDRYLLTFTMRFDGSSRFSDDNRWGKFPSAAFAWKMKEEGFLRDVEALSDLKLRLGWGITGQQAVVDQDFPYLPTYNISNQYAQYLFGDEGYNTLRPNAYNQNLKWEQTTTWNAGFDFGFLNGRISGSLDGYYRETKDLINKVKIPVGTNLSSSLIKNIGSLENYGVEFSINTKPVVTNDFTWDLSFNATWNHNEITRLTDADNDSYYVDSGDDAPRGNGNKAQAHKVGYPAGSFYVYQQVYDADGKPVQGMFVDRNGNGEIDLDDRYMYKKPAADVLMGLTSKMLWRNWDFSFALRASLNNYVYYGRLAENANVAADGLFANNTYVNVIKEAIDLGWTDFSNYRSDYFVQNASFLRCDNITLGYSFKNLFKSIYYGGATGRLYATVQNPFLITKYDGLDPEVSSGMDKNPYPRATTFLLGLSLQF